jgi:hypothetical protein
MVKTLTCQAPLFSKMALRRSARPSPVLAECRMTQAGSRMNELASKTSYYDAADAQNRKDTLVTADSLNALNVANRKKKEASAAAAASTRPAPSFDFIRPTGSKGLPAVKSPSPVTHSVSAQSYANTSAQMNAQLQQLNANIASLAARPMLAQVNLDGRKFGQAMFQLQQSNLAQIGGNGIGPTR